MKKSNNVEFDYEYITRHFFLGSRRLGGRTYTFHRRRGIDRLLDIVLDSAERMTLFKLYLLDGGWVDFTRGYGIMGEVTSEFITQYNADGVMLERQDMLHRDEPIGLLDSDSQPMAVFTNIVPPWEDVRFIETALNEPESNGCRTESFTYDDLGNRVCVENNYGLGFADEQDYESNELNQYEEITAYDVADACTVYELQYDASGNRISETGYAYSYDYENRLIKIRMDPNLADPNNSFVTVAQFAYDALGRRVLVNDVQADRETLFYYDNNYRVAYQTGSDRRSFVYGNGIDEVLAMYELGSPQSGDPNELIRMLSFCSAWLSEPNDSNWNADFDYDDSDSINMADFVNLFDTWNFTPQRDESSWYYMRDALGSVTGLVSSEGEPSEFYVYDAYGRPDALSDVGNPYYFTARRLDTFGGQYYFQYNRNRYYDYDTGSWLTADPLGIVPNGTMGNEKFSVSWQYRNSMSIYLYAIASPVDFTDQFGLRLSEHCGIYMKRFEVGLEHGLGHTWISGCGTSLGWWPRSDEVSLLDWCRGNTQGVVERPDPYGGVTVSDVTWTTGIRIDGVMLYGKRRGESCKCVTCKDVCSCIRSFNRTNVYGPWGDFDGVGLSLFDSEKTQFSGDCRDFARYVLNSCCLETTGVSRSGCRTMTVPVYDMPCSVPYGP